MMNKIIGLFALLIFALACGQPNNPLYQEVMDIHDEVMPKTSTIVRYSRSLRNELSDLPEEKKTVYLETIKALDDAEEAMMDWMANFDSSRGDSTYLLEEKKKIQAVSDQMYSSIAKAEKILDQK